MKLRQITDFYLRLDLRSLGAFRILLGAILLGDVLERWPHIEAFYTAGGVFVGVDRPATALSLLESFKTLAQAQGFFFFAAVCYGCLLVGYRTRLFHVLSLVCFLSILNRATMIRAGDDFAVAVMLMWTVFLPMGCRFSIDALGSGIARDSQDLAGRNLAAFGAIFQIGLIYLCTAVSKGGTTWVDGSAVYYALQLDQLTRPLGHVIGQLPPAIIKSLTWGTLTAEYLALPLMLCPFFQPYLRRAIIVALCSLHVGIALTTTLDLFAMKMMATFVLLLRAEDWARLQNMATRVAGRVSMLARWRDWRTTTFTSRATESTGSPATAGRLYFWAGQVMAGCVLATTLIEAYNSNLRKRLQLPVAPEPAIMRTFTIRTQLLQRWDLFAPNPSKEEGWWVIDGVTESGRRLDPLTGRAPVFEKPADLAARHSRPWRKYLSRINTKANEQYRAGFARYVTRINHRAFATGDRLAQFKLIYVVEKSPAPGGAAAALQRKQMLSWDCLGTGKPSPKPATSNRAVLAHVKGSKQ